MKDGKCWKKSADENMKSLYQSAQKRSAAECTRRGDVLSILFIAYLTRRSKDESCNESISLWALQHSTTHHRTAQDTATRTELTPKPTFRGGSLIFLRVDRCLLAPLLLGAVVFIL